MSFSNALGTIIFVLVGYALIDPEGFHQWLARLF